MNRFARAPWFWMWYAKTSGSAASNLWRRRTISSNVETQRHQLGNVHDLFSRKTRCDGADCVSAPGLDVLCDAFALYHDHMCPGLQEQVRSVNQPLWIACACRLELFNGSIATCTPSQVDISVQRGGNATNGRTECRPPAWASDHASL